MKNERRLFVMFLANTLLLVFLAPVSTHAFFQEIHSELRYQGASVWQAVLDPLATLFEPFFTSHISPPSLSRSPLLPQEGEGEEKEQKEVLIVNNPQTNTPSKQEILSWIKDILKLQNTETYTSVPSQNIYNTYPTEVREIRTSGGSQGLADSLSSSLTNIDNRFTQITNSYTFLSPSLTNATLTGETTIDSHLLLSATSAPSTTANRLYNTGGDLYWAGNLIGGASTGVWGSDGTNVYRLSGRVMVGTSSPSTANAPERGAIDIAATGSLNALRLLGNDYPNSAITLANLGNLEIGALYITPDTTQGSSHSLRLTSSGVPSLVLQENGGKTGVGTTSPSAKLSVKGGGTTTGRAFAISNSSDAEKFTVLDNGTVTFGPQANGGYTQYTYNAGNGVQSFALSAASNGRVNIVDSADNAFGGSYSTNSAGGIMLGGSGINSYITSGWDGSFVPQLLLQPVTGKVGIGTTTPFASLSVNNIAGTPGFVVGSSTATSFIVDKNGRVGVGTTAPSQLLSVGATNQFTVTGAGAVVAAGTVSANLFNYTGGNADILAAGGLGVITRANTTEVQLTTNSYWQTLTAYTNGTEKMRISSTGNVGIGTTSPAAKLHVSGGLVRFDYPDFADILLVGTGQTADNKIWSLQQNGLTLVGRAVNDAEGSASTWLTVTRNGAYINSVGLFAGNSERVRINSDGNVGIGTTTPNVNLTVVKSGQAPTDLSSAQWVGSFTNNSSPSSVARVGIYSGPSAQALLNFGGNTDADIGGISYDNSDNSMAFRTNNAEWARITSAGNLGVGTTSPSAKLSVKGGGTTTGRAFAISNSSDVEKFTVLDNGSVGIGTTSPATKLSIVTSTSGDQNALSITPGTSGYFMDALFSINSAGGIPYFRIGNGTGDGLSKVIISASNSALYDTIISKEANVSTYQSYMTRFSIERGGTAYAALDIDDGQGNTSPALKTYGATQLAVTSGNVGIATTSPWRTLSVNGTMATPGLVNDSTGYYACVNTTTGQLATSTTACGASSERFKENIQDLSYGLSEVLSLRPVSFDYKDSYIKDSTHQLGFIAEEVDLLIPELVAKDSQGQIQGLDYPKFTSVIVKAVQELNAKVDSILGQINQVLAWFTDGNFHVQGDFCVNETCVTRDQLEQIILQAGVGATQTVGSQNLESGIQEEENQSATTTEEIASSTPTADIPDSDPLLNLGEVSVPSSVPLGEVSSSTPEI